MSEPQIGFVEYSYHYQRPDDHLFFRYDFHPNIGEANTHPIYHLHAGGWRHDVADFPLVPRFPVIYTSLDDVLEIIRMTYF